MPAETIAKKARFWGRLGFWSLFPLAGCAGLAYWGYDTLQHSTRHGGPDSAAALLPMPEDVAALAALVLGGGATIVLFVVALFAIVSAVVLSSRARSAF